LSALGGRRLERVAGQHAIDVTQERAQRTCQRLRARRQRHSAPGAHEQRVAE